jgi:hypothetical protein
LVSCYLVAVYDLQLLFKSLMLVMYDFFPVLGKKGERAGREGEEERERERKDGERPQRER